jgi:hypothetical protein
MHETICGQIQEVESGIVELGIVPLCDDRPESRSDPQCRCKALDCFTSVVGDQEISHFVPFGPGRWLQRFEGTGLIEVLGVSILTAPTKPSLFFCELQKI